VKAQLKDLLRLARWKARRAKVKMRVGGANAPILFANSFPKSGTHLLTQVLEGFPQIGPFVESGLPAITMYAGATGERTPTPQIVRRLQRYRPGDMGYGHLHAEPEIVAALCRPEFAPFFILRDPRDVVVSHVFYVTELEPNHVHHTYYTEELSTFDERLRVSILGRPELDVEFPDIRERFVPYLGWLDQEAVLTLHFEDLITDQEAALGRILAHVITRGLEFSGDRGEAIRTLAGVINPSHSPTFRSGKVGGWRKHFTPELTALFKEVTGDMLVKLGYEKDMDW